MFSLAARLLVRSIGIAGSKGRLALKSAALLADGIILSAALSLAVTYGSIAALAVALLVLAAAFWNRSS